ncbi:sulfatase [Microbacterium sp. ZW CA_36]|uniref:sulfatase family protein n=1 Tax=Microbacterium sp. ZW CA_36 TaxID=3378078 RepID=UPI0038520550
MRTNIVVFLTDDHAQWAAGCYGNSELRTPTLDHLANTGVVYENAYTTSPVCSPARASFFTGRLPSQHGVHDYLSSADPEVRDVSWLAGENLLPEVLQGNGYVTALSGKWHLGREEEVPRGFDYWYCRSAPVSEASAYRSPWPLTPSAERAYNRQAITDHGVEFLRQHDREQPFFLVIGHLATHSPWTDVPDRLVDQYRDATFRDIPQDVTYPFGRQRSESLYSSRNDPREALAQYYGAVTDIDEQVGRVLDELDALGLRESTAVIYTSDHGLNAGHHGLWGKGNATLPYNVLDESIRIPLIVNRPGHMLGRQRRIENVNHTDTFQTILDIAGCETPESIDTPYPGRSYADTLTGERFPGAREDVFVEYGNLRMVRTPRHKLVRRYPEGPDQLFDLRADPRETTNVIDYPDNASLTLELSAAIDDYFGRYEKPETAGTRVLEQPRHNVDEAWRDATPATISSSHAWLDALEASIQERRAAAGAGVDAS